MAVSTFSGVAEIDALHSERDTCRLDIVFPRSVFSSLRTWRLWSSSCYIKGAIFFWPCAKFEAYGGFVACTFVIGASSLNPGCLALLTHSFMLSQVAVLPPLKWQLSKDIFIKRPITPKLTFQPVRTSPCLAPPSTRLHDSTSVKDGRD